MLHVAILRIAVADDDPRILEAIQDVLRLEGHEVVGARNGTELLRVLNADPLCRPWRERPVPVHLVLLDLSMPEMTGDDVLEFFKRNRRYAHLPVILITARAHVSLPDYQKEYPNVVGLLAKPFDAEALYRAVAPIAARRAAVAESRGDVVH